MSLSKLSGIQPRYFVPADQSLASLSNHLLVDGFDFVLDLNKSVGSRLVDARNGKSYIDFFTCFASIPVGINHPKLSNVNFIDYLGRTALTKPSNSDIYSEEYATFVNTFFKIAVPKEYKYGFFIDGGALAVENALKVAFDWKVRKNLAKGLGEKGHQIIHFHQAFHGRSGYTMSLTNTDPTKVKYYPKFDWPRITNPKIQFPLNEENLANVITAENTAVEEIKSAFRNNPDDIAAIIIEPIQGEGGDNHFRPEFMKKLRELANENDALLIFDEVQTGMGITGTFWTFEQLGIQPDIFVFGKKSQICGICATERVDDIPDNVFHTSSRINSTWGGNLVDMVRSTRYLEIIEEEKLLDNVKLQGKILRGELVRLQEEFPNKVSNIRNRGLFGAFDISETEMRNKFIKKAMENGLFILSCGEKSVRFRPVLNIKADCILEGFDIIRKTVRSLI
jgi:L-lysine 6-transaminase